LRRRAPAKINLYLHVLGRRGDGYHLLDGLVVFTDIGDVLQAERTATLSLEISGPFAHALEAGAARETNLVLRAAEALKRCTGISEGAALSLEKRLPVASGIGGGSSDAAAALHLLNALWALGRSETELAEIGSTLGSDVPVCVAGGPAFISGIGEVISPCPSLPVLSLVLVNPGVALATPAVYRAYAAAAAGLAAQAPARPKDPCSDEKSLIAALRAARNDLEGVAIGLCPRISDALSALRAQERCVLARMSGSGATCFGIFSAHADAERAAQSISRAEPAWWVKPARTLSAGVATEP
jgi:4-diphosphocytidyl-2-C-methyl-D-erythritol kinase